MLSLWTLTVSLAAKQRSRQQDNTKFITIQDKRPSPKASLGRYLNSIHWSTLTELATREEKLLHFLDLLSNGINTMLPTKTIKINSNEPPWITTKFKRLIKKRQEALANDNIVTFNYYRNLVNRQRKTCRAKFYASKVKDLNESNLRDYTPL